MTRADVFQLIFEVFMGLGTLVGIVVVAYIMYNAYAYRDRDKDEDPAPESRPTMGELPVGGKGGKKLFLSFGLSAIIVVSLIIWTYGMLLYVEDGPSELGGVDEPQVENQEQVDEYLQLQVEAQTFNFIYNYNYQNSSVDNKLDTLIVPANEPVAVNVTSRDVWHTWGVPQQRVKADAIPGEYENTWFEADEPGRYETAVSSPDELESYLAAQEESDNGNDSGDGNGDDSNGDDGDDSSDEDGQNNESGGDDQ